jgi:hypothetical protein
LYLLMNFHFSLKSDDRLLNEDQMMEDYTKIFLFNLNKTK